MTPFNMVDMYGCFVLLWKQQVSRHVFKYIYQTTRRNIPEDGYLKGKICCECLVSFVMPMADVVLMCS